MGTIRTFDAGICAAVSTVESKDQHLTVGEKGILADVPANVKGFHLFIGLPEDIWAFVVQRNVGLELGGYSADALTSIGSGGNGLRWTALATPVTVKRAGKNVWTVWHTETPNRVDVWLVGPKGCMALYQIGVVTHDDGASWRLHGELRWKGKLFLKDGELVACPDEPRVKWGPFVTWKTVFDHPEFRRMVNSAEIETWAGKPTDLEPALPRIPVGNYAVVQWFVPFAGQTGQGYVWMTNGGRDPASIHGVDLLVHPDPDGVKRLHRGDIVTYERTDRFGSKQSLKLLRIELYVRSW